MLFFFFSFRITQSKYANKKMASNSVVIVSIVYAVSFVIKYLRTTRNTVEFSRF